MKKITFLTTALVAAVLITSCAKQSDPVITLNGDPQMQIYMGETFTDPGATATDYKDRDISSDIKVDGTVGSASGTYNLDYTVTDKKGNFGHTARTVVRGFKNTNLVGTYNVIEVSNNGGGTHTFTGTITASANDIITVTLNNMNSTNAPAMMNAYISSMGSQINIPDQSYSNIDITNGLYGFLSTNSAGKTVITVSYQTFNGIMTMNHDATWTMQ